MTSTIDGQAIGKRMRAIRMMRRMTQSQLSDMTGISRRSIGLYESGETIPGSVHVLAIAKALDCSTDALLATVPLNGIEG